MSIEIQPPSGMIAVPVTTELELETPLLNIPGRRGRLGRMEGTLVGIASVVVVLALWQLLAPIFYKPLFLPVPTDVVKAFGQLVRDGSLWNDLWVSTQEMLLGYSMSIVLGLPLGILMGWYRRFNYGLDPFVAFFNATPRVALTPLLIIWFGIGIWSKVAVVFLGAIFPILMNTAAGVKNLDGNLVKAARSFGASDSDMFRTVALPGSVPYILTGLRVGLGHALTGVVVGEQIAAQAGIGRMMFNAGASFQTPKVFAGLIIVAGAGVLLSVALMQVENRYQSWRPSR
jgi:ABC-type nitrate/sulfonate/bicarbonate transport system permease component